MEENVVITTVLVLMCASVCMGLYFIQDYYMEKDWAFGQACGKTVEDDCLYINSHLDYFGITKYGKNIECVVQIDAGNQHDSRYKLKFTKFELDSTTDCNGDYLEIYDADYSGYRSNNSDMVGRFCGSQEPNMTGYPTQQAMVLKFKTDSSGSADGFRILATRTLPYPCADDYFHCKAENRCIDGRLQCDGTPQCDDETDEDDCTWFQKFLGAFIALGVSGLVGVGLVCVCGCTGIGIGICACTCCRQMCCGKCCKPNRVNDSSGSHDPRNDVSMVTQGSKQKHPGSPETETVLVTPLPTVVQVNGTETRPYSVKSMTQTTTVTMVADQTYPNNGVPNVQ